jgi:hypothetical protein
MGSTDAKYTNQLTPVEQSPWEANSSSRNSQHFMEPEVQKSL